MRSMAITTKTCNTEDRLIGMMVGLAVGDALGAPLEFLKPGEFEPVEGMTPGGEDNKKAPEGASSTRLEGPVRLELTTPCLKGRCSNQLSYGPGFYLNKVTGVIIPENSRKVNCI